MTFPPRRRVLHLVDSGGLYGAERVILNLSLAMARSGTLEPVIGCIVNDATDRVELVDVARSVGLEAHAIAVINARLPFSLIGFARRLRSLRVDVVHSHGYKPSVFAHLVRPLTRVPVMATCHLWFVDASSPWRMRAMIRLEQRLYRFFPAIVAVSDDIRRVLLARGVPDDRVHVVPNGVDVEAFASVRDERESRNARIPNGPLRVLNAGRLTPQKDQQTIVDAAALLAASNPDIRFQIVGDGELRADLESRIESRGVSRTVELHGFRPDIDRVLTESDVFLLPSLAEGMPMSLLEAVAAEVPVIATAVGDIGKLIRHERTGLVVPPGDPAAVARAVSRLASDPGLRRTLSRSALDALRTSYSTEHMFAEYQRIYAQLN